MKKRALTIAGSAARGGAGIQADIKTFQELGVYGAAAITAIVARHPVTEQGIFLQSVEAVEAQIHTVLADIGCDALKTGMLFQKETIEKVAELLQSSDVTHRVIDPVMIGKMGSKLLKEDAINALCQQLIPLATIITPNMYEAAYLTNQPLDALQSVEDLKKAAITLKQLGSSYVLVKGGQLEGPAIDILYNGDEMYEVRAPRIDTLHTNGAGCTYSAAITAELAKGKSVIEAVTIAKKYITAGIRQAVPYLRGPGPTDHTAYRTYGENEVQVVRC